MNPIISINVFAYPTESFYALGVDATDKKAIRRLFRVKHREPGKPIALIAADLAQVKRFFHLSQEELKLAKKYWPGALTIILRPKAKIAARALGARRIGVRVPQHANARKLCKLAGVPLTATSANISGQPPTKSYYKIKKDFPDIMVIPGRCGRSTKPSTVVSVKKNGIEITRPGAIRL